MRSICLLNSISANWIWSAGAPRLTSAELQTACEDFSNIIETSTGCLVFKGILSSGVEIAVLSSSIRSLQQWSRSAEREFYRKVSNSSSQYVLLI